MNTNLQRISVLKWSNVIAFLLTIVVNALANIIPINGQTTGEISAKYPNLFTPAGFTFSIWILIYIALGAFVLYQTGLIFNEKEEADRYVSKIGWMFVIASLANTSWIFLWHYEMIILSLAAMIVLLISLISIYNRIDCIKYVTNAAKLFVQAPFSIYLGWISVATIANITVFLVSVNWNGFGLSDQFWTVVTIVLALLLSIYMLYKKNDILYGLVIAWVLVGIIAKQVTYFDSKYTSIIIAAAVSLLVILGLVVYRIITKAKRE